jgi:hypothetical protein
MDLKSRVMAQAVSRRALSAEAQVCAGSVHVGSMVDKVTLEQAFLRVLWFPYQHKSTMTLHTHNMRDKKHNNNHHTSAYARHYLHDSVITQYYQQTDATVTNSPTSIPLPSNLP